GAKDENTGAGLCRSRLVVQERLGHYSWGLVLLADSRTQLPEPTRGRLAAFLKALADLLSGE
ncbi:hypothetical protein ACK3Z1_19740, partial [Aeromonas caviae]